MYSFGKASKQRYNTVHPKLQEILDEAIKIIDFTIVCGHRTEGEQTLAYERGNTKVKWPRSKHNSYPANAVDVAPYPIDWNNLGRFYYLQGVMRGIAHEKGIKVRFGGDWNGDGELSDNRFNDLPHIELL